MATLHAASLLENIEKSLNAYISAALVTAEGLAVHYSGQLSFVQPAQWVSISTGLLDSLADYSGALTTTEAVDRRRGFLDFSLCEQTQQRVDLYAMAILRDKVLRHFPTGQGIPIRDYDTVGTPIVGYLQCGEHRGRLVDEGRESGLAQYSLSVPVQFLERRSM